MSNVRYDLKARNVHTDSDKAKLLYVSTAKYGGDWFSMPHTHKCAELFYVIGGKGQFLVQNNSFTISGGDLIIVNPDVEHTETSLAACPLEYIVMGIEGLELTMDDTTDNSFCRIDFRDDRGEIQFYLRSMLSEIEQKQTGFETVCQDLLDIFLIKLLRKTNFSKVLASSQEDLSTDTVTLRRYIEAHYKEPLTLDILAERVHMNKFHMAHTFSREFGISPISYIQKLRLRESRRLLSTTDHSLSQISRMCGFSSPSYFSQRFRLAEGLSPAQYRRQKHNPDADAAPPGPSQRLQ